MHKREVNMLSGPIAKGLLTIAVPVMVMNVLQSLFNMIDMTILKTFDTGGGTAVGAVGTCGTLITLVTCLLIGSATGTNVIVAKYIGKGSKEHVERSVGASVLLAFIGGIILMVVGIIFAGVFLSWTNCPEELMSQAVTYFRLYFVGMPILMVYNFCAAILRSAGDSRGPMVYLTVGGVVKVLLTYLFVGGFRMQVAGVAVATIISWAASAVLAIRALVRFEGAVALKLNRIRFYKEELVAILRIGVPAGIQKALYSVANVVIVATVNSFGAAATTGISIANTFDGLLYQITSAASFAVMPYVSQNVGKGNIKRATQSVNRGILITTVLGLIFGILSAVFSAPLASIMSGDPEVIAFAQQKMVIISTTYFICGISEIYGAALRGMGRPTVATIATLLFMCVLRFVWVYGLFPFCPNITFLYLVWPVGWTLCTLMLMCCYFPTVKKLYAKAAANEPLK